MHVLTQIPVLKALGWALFNSLWQMALLWLLYSLFIAVVPKTSPSVRHRLSLIMINTGAIWTGLGFFAALSYPGNEGAFILSMLPPVPAAAAGFWHASGAVLGKALPYGSAVYLLILAGLGARYCSQYQHARKLTRRGLTVLPPQFRTFASSTALQLGIRATVKTWMSSVIDVPLTLGFLKPVILIPAAMVTQLTTQQVEAILIHELAHIQRKDYLLHLLVTLLDGLYFFNPFARLLIRQLKKERENCCDDLVLQFKYDAHAYVSALLSLASRHQPIRQMAVAATGTGDRLLLERAKRILLRQNGKRLRPATRPLFLLLFTAVITVMTVYHPLLQPRRSAKPAIVRLTDLSPAPTVSAREMAAGHLMTSIPPPKMKKDLAARTRTFRHRSVTANDVAGLDKVPVDDLIVNTVEEGSGLTSPDIATPAASPEPANDDDAPVAEGRDYSLNIPQTISGTAAPSFDGSPFVPNSSFSFQYMLGDSVNSEEKLLYLQQSAQLDVLGAIAKLQQQTAAQLMALSNQMSNASESVRLRKQIRARQIQLRQDYIRKIETWQNKLQKTAHIKVIVYI